MLSATGRGSTGGVGASPGKTVEDWGAGIAVGVGAGAFAGTGRVGMIAGSRAEAVAAGAVGGMEVLVRAGSVWQATVGATIKLISARRNNTNKRPMLTSLESPVEDS